MTTDTLAFKRGMNVYAITAICVVVALMQLTAGLMVLNRAPDGMAAAPGQQFILGFVVLSWAISTLLLLVTGAAVYLMRTEALAIMAYLLVHNVAKLVGGPFLLVGVLDLPFYPILMYFTIRMFERSAALPPARANRLHLFTMVLFGLAAGHLAELICNAWAYHILVSIGSLSPILALAALAGCIAFYTAVVTITSRPERTRKLFLFAALFTGLLLPACDLRWGVVAPLWLEVPMALFGFWLARRWSGRAYTGSLTTRST
jgi:hypothetical protein